MVADDEGYIQIIDKDWSLVCN